MAEIKLTKENFKTEAMESGLPVIIDLWATWCGPCRMLGPVIEELAEEYDGKLKVCKVNVDEEPELAEAFHVTSIPLVIKLENGKVTASSLGYKPKETLKRELGI